MGHLVICNSFGYINAYGFFEAYYVESLGLSSSVLAWPGSIQIFLALLGGVFSGRACDAGFLRAILAAGFFFQLLGIFSTSFCKTYWQILLAQGICQGLGNGMVFTPAVSTVATYFHKRRALAIALVSCGNATGGVIFPLLAQQLIPRIGFPWAVRVMGFVMMINMAVVLPIAKKRLPPRKSGPLVEWSAFKDIPWVLFVVSTFLMYLVLFFAMTYVSGSTSPVPTGPQLTL
jgi:MFS family permease